MGLACTWVVCIRVDGLYLFGVLDAAYAGWRPFMLVLAPIPHQTSLLFSVALPPIESTTCRWREC